METTSPAVRVTALIVSRNCAADLRRCLAALDASVPREGLEILVVDNGSADESGTLDSEFPSAQFLRMPKNFGATKALNIALRTAKGEFVFLLPPRIAVEADTIARLVAKFEERADVGAVCADTERTYPLPTVPALEATWRTGIFPGAKSVDRNEAEVEVDFPNGAAMLVRRAFIAGMNYFDDRFGEFGPYLELCWQIRSAGRKILVIPSIHVSESGPAEIGKDTNAVADRVSGSGVYIGKHFGTGAAIGFRLKAALAALGSFDFGLLGAILGGRKIDGNQAGA